MKIGKKAERPVSNQKAFARSEHLLIVILILHARNVRKEGED